MLMWVHADWTHGCPLFVVVKLSPNVFLGAGYLSVGRDHSDRPDRQQQHGHHLLTQRQQGFHLQSSYEPIRLDKFVLGKLSFFRFRSRSVCSFCPLFFELGILKLKVFFFLQSCCMNKTLWLVSTLSCHDKYENNIWILVSFTFHRST